MEYVFGSELEEGSSDPLFKRLLERLEPRLRSSESSSAEVSDPRTTGPVVDCDMLRLDESKADVFLGILIELDIFNGIALAEELGVVGSGYWGDRISNDLEISWAQLTALRSERSGPPCLANFFNRQLSHSAPAPATNLAPNRPLPELLPTTRPAFRRLTPRSRPARGNEIDGIEEGEGVGWGTAEGSIEGGEVGAGLGDMDFGGEEEVDFCGGEGGRDQWGLGLLFLLLLLLLLETEDLRG